MIRIMHGEWVTGYLGYIGISTNMHVELKVLYVGLRIAWRLRYKKVECNLDCAEAINLISRTIPYHHRCGSIIADIIHLLQRAQ